MIRADKTSIFPLAKMSPLLMGLTLIMLALPAGFLAGSLLVGPYLWIPAAIMIPLYA